MWIRIFSSDNKSLYSASVALSVEKQKDVNVKRDVNEKGEDLRTNKICVRHHVHWSSIKDAKFTKIDEDDDENKVAAATDAEVDDNYYQIMN